MENEVNDIRRTIDTREDVQTDLIALAKLCPVLKNLISQIDDVPLRRTEPGFASLASIIISQQVSKASAEAIYGRMRQLITPLTAERYIECGEDAWIKIGLSRPKQRTFLALCSAICEDELVLSQMSELSADEAMAQMTVVKGIGPWTAEVYLLFAVGHRDIFPSGDMALQQATADAYGLKARPTDKEMRKIAESWRPWRSVAARLLWAYYGAERKREVMP